MGPINNVTNYRISTFGLFLVSVCILLVVYPFTLKGEQVRSEIQHTLTIDDSYSDIHASIGLRELSLIRLEAREFLRGLVIQVEAPNAVLQFRESFLLNIYYKASPRPQEGVGRYSATKLYSEPFPSSRKTFIDIPFATEKSWDKSTLNSTVVASRPIPEEYPLLFSIDPIMKGIPSNVANSHFKIQVIPVLIDKGALVVELPEDVNRDVIELRIDGQRKELNSRRFILSTGVHEVSVESTHYLPFSKSVAIEKAKTSKVQVSLTPSRSRIHFDAPDDAVVFFDGEEIDIGSSSKLHTEPGEHMVLVRIGDYSVSKKIDIEGGKDYKVSLFFDILINDN